MANKILVHTQCFVQLETRFTLLLPKTGSVFAEDFTLHQILQDRLMKLELNQQVLNLTFLSQNIRKFQVKVFFSKIGDYDADGIPVGIQYDLDVPLSLVRHLPLCRDGLYVTFVLDGAKNVGNFTVDTTGVTHREPTASRDCNLRRSVDHQGNIIISAVAAGVTVGKPAAVEVANTPGEAQTFPPKSVCRVIAAEQTRPVVADEQRVVSTSGTHAKSKESVVARSMRDASHESDNGIAEIMDLCLSTTFPIDIPTGLEIASSGFGFVTAVMGDMEVHIKEEETHVEELAKVQVETLRTIPARSKCKYNVQRNHTTRPVGSDIPDGNRQGPRKPMSKHFARKSAKPFGTGIDGAVVFGHFDGGVCARIKKKPKTRKRLFPVMTDEKLKLLSPEELKRCINIYTSIMRNRRKREAQLFTREMEMDEDFLKRARLENQERRLTQRTCKHGG